MDSDFDNAVIVLQDNIELDLRPSDVWYLGHYLQSLIAIPRQMPVVAIAPGHVLEGYCEMPRSLDFNVFGYVCKTLCCQNQQTLFGQASDGLMSQLPQCVEGEALMLDEVSTLLPRLTPPASIGGDGISSPCRRDLRFHTSGVHPFWPRHKAALQ